LAVAEVPFEEADVPFEEEEYASREAPGVVSLFGVPSPAELVVVELVPVREAVSLVLAAMVFDEPLLPIEPDVAPLLLIEPEDDPLLLPLVPL
jgi:hypothetical protein